MIIKKATSTDISKVASLVYDAFEQYELFNIGEDKASKANVLRKLLTINMKINISSGYCYLCFDNEQLVGVFNLIPPHMKQPSVIDYIKSGALKIILTSPWKTLIQLLKNIHRAEDIMAQDKKDYWYLDTLVIDPNSQGSGYGSKILTLIKEKVTAPAQLKLITNAERNAVFYRKNGFHTVRTTAFKQDSSTIKTWLFEYQQS
ncbi:GNAT family N-acetyltransferase [Leuconostoc rapi]|uniref:GNAT family N-acetyltransferase n=1 Tax=Leuconostoc rapi TaxID=1406906 RepID=UPI00195B98AB|nr:GNAT family N-acetyltransferase [Leuconostoc rapi]MBM7436188.1 N-acetylglutamate synthase-like GNAT family acetyltransferase [Leuconostoc rapi]